MTVPEWRRMALAEDEDWFLERNPVKRAKAARDIEKLVEAHRDKVLTPMAFEAMWNGAEE